MWAVASQLQIEGPLARSSAAARAGDQRTAYALRPEPPLPTLPPAMNVPAPPAEETFAARARAAKHENGATQARRSGAQPRGADRGKADGGQPTAVDAPLAPMTFSSTLSVPAGMVTQSSPAGRNVWRGIGTAWATSVRPRALVADANLRRPLNYALTNDGAAHNLPERRCREAPAGQRHLCRRQACSQRGGRRQRQRGERVHGPLLPNGGCSWQTARSRP